MKQQYLKNWFFIFGVNIVLLVVVVSIFRSIFLPVSALKTEVMLLIGALIVGSILLWTSLVALVMLFFQRMTDSAVGTQLTLLERGNYQKMKSSLQDIWYHVIFTIPLEDFYGKTRQIAARQEQLTNELQQYSSRPQLVGEQTREEIVEMERHRIARELHDSVSQQLFAAMMMLSAMSEQKEQLTPLLQKQLTMVEKVVNDSQSEMRALLLHLRPISLENKTLKQGIEGLLKELQTKVQMQIHWELEDISLRPGIEDHLFRITQELLSNTLRHSHAEHLEVYLRQTEDFVLLKVTDDGVGFDQKEQKPGSYGLTNIKERVQGMGGTLKIVSFPNQGTNIEIKIQNVSQMEEQHD